MKKIIAIILISYIFCDLYLPKYDSIETELESAVFYLKASEFSSGSTIYFQLNCKNGNVNEDLIYEFSDKEPNEHTSHEFVNPNALKVSSRGKSSNNDQYGQPVSVTNKFYYEITNDGSKKYLFIEYKGFRGTLLEIENTRFSILY